MTALTKHLELLELPNALVLDVRLAEQLHTVLLDAYVPDISSMPSQSFIVKNSPLGLDRKDLEVEEVSDFYRDYQLSLFATLVVIVYGTFEAAENVIISGRLRGADGASGASRERVISLQLTPQIFAADLRPRLRQRRLSSLRQRPWCRLKQDPRGRFQAIVPFVF